MTSSLTQLRSLSEQAHNQRSWNRFAQRLGRERRAGCAGARAPSRIADTQIFAQFVPRLRASRTRGDPTLFPRFVTMKNQVGDVHVSRPAIVHPGKSAAALK